MCTKGIHGRVSINTLDQYPWSTPLIDIWDSVFERHPDRYLVDTWSTICQQLAECQLTHMHQLKISQLSTDCQPRCWWSVDGMSTKVSMECQLSSYWVSIKGLLGLLWSGIWETYVWVCLFSGKGWSEFKGILNFMRKFYEPTLKVTKMQNLSLQA